MSPDTLLTIFALLLAIFALVPRERRLDTLLRTSSIDWAVVGLAFLLVHYILYFPVLSNLGLSFDLGPWRWGFDEKNTTYLIFLLLFLYLFTRTRKAVLARSNLAAFSELFERLLLQSRFDELALLLEDHLGSLVRIKNSALLRNKIAKAFEPPAPWADASGRRRSLWLQSRFPNQMKSLWRALQVEDSHASTSSAILRRIFRSVGFVRHLASSRPYLGLRALELDIDGGQDFLTLYIRSLIEDRGSIYYYELEHAQNSHGHRVELDPGNRLLCYFFQDVHVSKKLGVYKPVGDTTCELLEHDEVLIRAYNKPLGRYHEQQRFSCPIDRSIWFFNIMILESMHQGIKWHMWLYYFPAFVENILDAIDPDASVDLHAEWPTPFHFLLYNVVTRMLDWLEEYLHVADKTPLVWENNSLEHDNGSIPKSAVLAIGVIFFSILRNRTLHDQFKIYLIEILARYLRRNKHERDLAELNDLLVLSVLKRGYFDQTSRDYLEDFGRLYGNVDHLLRAELQEIEDTYEKLIDDLH